MQTDDRFRFAEGTEYPEWDDAVDFLRGLALAALVVAVVLGVWG